MRPGQEVIGAEIETVRELLDELEAKGLLSDARATESVIHSKAPRLGQRGLEQALRAKQLPQDLIDEALTRTRHTELDRAREVWGKRFHSPPVSSQDRARQQRFLAGRGFESGTIQRLLRELGTPVDDHDELP